MKLLLPKFNRGGESEGFTLVELLVVIGILTILLSIALIAINPLRQFKQADNTRRRSDILAILNAITEYAADNSGSLPGILGSVTGSAETIASDTSAGNIDFCTNIVPTYIAAMPYDPDSGNWTSCSSYDTGYTVVVSESDNRVTVNAPDAELSESININR
jgi:prepilin-type N-terminal cleavage/methylation domain-containing protein